MPITIHKLPRVPETYFVEEARTIPTAQWGLATGGAGFLGSRIRRLSGQGITAGWALTVSCPTDSNLATYVALQYMRDNPSSGRWVMVVAPQDESETGGTAMWSYLQSAMAWEVSFVGAVVAAYIRDIDETRTKLEKEFSLFGYGGSAIPAALGTDGEIGCRVTINGVTVRTGDLIVGDSDGVLCVPKDQIEHAAEKCRNQIIDEVNLLQHVRGGRGAAEVMGLDEMLAGNIDLVE